MSDKLKQHRDKGKKRAKRLLLMAALTMKKEALKNLPAKTPETVITITISDDGMNATVETHFANAVALEYGPDGKPFFNQAFEIARQILTMNDEL